MATDPDKTTSSGDAKAAGSNPLKRPEVWLLLIGALAVIIWVLTLGGGESEGESSSRNEATNPEQLIRDAEPTDKPTITSRRVKRDFSNALLEIDIDVTVTEDEPMSVKPPAVRLVGSKGTEVPPFILPFHESAVLQPGDSKSVTLRYWLDETHFSGGLWLHVQDTTIEIKDTGRLDIESLENQATIEFTSASWSTN